MMGAHLIQAGGCGARGLAVEMIDTALKHLRSPHLVDPDTGRRGEHAESARRWVLGLESDAALPVDVACSAAGVNWRAMIEQLSSEGVLG
jgi:hypothetical protein